MAKILDRSARARTIAVMRLTCPEPDCDFLAEVSDHTDLGSTDGPVLHVSVACLDGHRFFMPWEKLDITADLAS